MKALINWKVFLILWIASLLAVIAVLPYTLALQSSLLQNLPASIPLSVVLVAQVIQSVVMFAIATFAGLFFASRVGLGAPILEAATRGESVWDRVRAVLPLSVLLGVIGTLVILGLEAFLFQPALLNELGDAAAGLNLWVSPPAAWKGLLASFYGGIAEEILLRLFLMSLLVWLGRFLSQTSEGKPTPAVIGIANILAAILFGLGHLPAVATLVLVTSLVIARTVVLNGVLGIVFGWLYWKRGLEAAMISHFSADIVLHVLLAL